MRPLPFLFVLACGPGSEGVCPGLAPPDEDLPVSVPPFFQVRRSTVRLRLETSELVDVATALETPDARCPARTTMTPERATVTRAWPEDPTQAPHPDLAGDYTLHTLEIADIDPADPPLWRALVGPDLDALPSGTVPYPPTAEQGATVVFMGSLGPAALADVARLAAEQQPDLAILTGDLQRSDDPTSTWRGMWADLAPLTSTTLLHTAWGANDDEPDGELDQMALRWFGGQGRPGGTDRYYAVDAAGVRFLVLDGEDDRLVQDGSPQRKWITDEVGDLVTNPALREVVVILHRGPYSLAPERPFVELRDTLMPALAAQGVRVVVSGLGNGYQRFEAHDLLMLDDGGGGAPLADLDARAANDAGAVEARTMVSATHGLLRLDVAPDGSLTWTRLGLDGAQVDRVSLPAR